MLVRCWGARGSIPVSGREFLVYGGDTACMEIRSRAGEIVILDAGTGIRPLGIRLAREGVRHVSLLFTHRHWDHVMGFPFFRLIYNRANRVEVYGCPFAQESVRQMLSRTMQAPYFPIQLDDISAELTYRGICREPIEVGGMRVESIFLSHPNEGIGYRITDTDGRSFVFLTDNEFRYEHPGGMRFEDYVAFSRGADLLVHDAEWRPEEYEKHRGWGHSTFEDAARVAREAGVRQLGLYHHNQERTDAEVDRMVADCTGLLAGSGVHCFACATGGEVVL